MEDKNKKIGIIALIFALLALSQASAISSVTMTLIAGTGINITQSGDNYTITATGNTSIISNSYTGTKIINLSSPAGIQSFTGVGFMPSAVTFQSTSPGGSSSSSGIDSNGTSSYTGCNFAGTCVVSKSDSVYSSPGAAQVFYGHITQLNNDGFNMTFAKVGSPTGNMYVYFTAYK
jgi:hypothetical protein